MKKLLSLCLALALLALAACGAAPEAPDAPDAPKAPSAPETPVASAAEGAGDTADTIPAPAFTLTDQYGESHSLDDYAGKVVFLNFWATWCGPCQGEMPDIEQLYQDHGLNEGDVIVLGVSEPANDDNPRAADVSAEEVTAFMEDGGYTYPTLMDTTGEVFGAYAIQAYPTTYVIDGEGNVAGGTQGALSYENMEKLLEMAM